MISILIRDRRGEATDRRVKDDVNMEEVIEVMWPQP